MKTLPLPIYLFSPHATDGGVVLFSANRRNRLRFASRSNTLSARLARVYLRTSQAGMLDNWIPGGGRRSCAALCAVTYSLIWPHFLYSLYGPLRCGAYDGMVVVASESQSGLRRAIHQASRAHLPPNSPCAPLKRNPAGKSQAPSSCEGRPFSFPPEAANENLPGSKRLIGIGSALGAATSLTTDTSASPKKKKNAITIKLVTRVVLYLNGRRRC